jgi:anti-sigma regulatory factor (Ser/Thr protein kinase)
MAATLLRHDAFVYDSETQFADRMVPFIGAGLEQGEAAVAVTTPANCNLLREALGAASERVLFVDRDQWYDRPARVIAGYDRTLRESALAGVPGVRVVGEVQFGETPRDWAEWTAYESIINRAFADRPAWIVCPYDARALPDAIVENAVKTHPHSMGAARHENTHYDDPAHLVRTLTPEPAPLADLRTVPLDDEGCGLRELLSSEMAAIGIPRVQAAQFLVAVSEVLFNARRHGDAPAKLRMGLVDGHFVCEISDNGPGLDDPLAGYVPPRPDQEDGAGLWVARQLSSRLELMSSADGLTVRLWL